MNIVNSNPSSAESQCNNLSRRNFIAGVGGFAFGTAKATEDILSTSEAPLDLVPIASITKKYDVFDSAMKDLVKQYPHLSEIGNAYDKKMRTKLYVPPNAYSLEKWLKFGLHPEYQKIIMLLCRAFKLDFWMIQRLVLHESAGSVTAESHKWAQGLMQITPIAAEDLYKSMPLYKHIISRIPKELVDMVNPTTKNHLWNVLSFDNLLNTRWLEGLAQNRFDPYANLIMGHVYFAGQQFLVSQIPHSQLSKMAINAVRSIKLDDLIRISQSRKALGQPGVNLEFLHDRYSRDLKLSYTTAMNHITMMYYNAGQSVYDKLQNQQDASTKLSAEARQYPIIVNA